MNNSLLSAAMLVASLGLSAPSSAADSQSLCGACHQLTKPDITARGIAERLERKAPPLWYAGDKYREGWLARWLQAPVTISPVGHFPNAAIRSTPEGDVPDPDKLHRHEALSADDAETVAAELMALKPNAELIAAVNYAPASLVLRMGTLDFRKFKGCHACHQDAAGEGGFSGPELYTAWERLEPAFIASFVTDPKAWDGNTIMPRLEMNEAAVNKLVDYLRLIGGAQ